ncbi:MAG: hypothetical protein AAFU64_16215, partial [Bacteroidota bacterium]
MTKRFGVVEINKENQLEWIERYLDQQLSADELVVLQQALQQNPSFQEALENHQKADQLILDSLKREKYRRDFHKILEKNTPLFEQEYPPSASSSPTYLPFSIRHLGILLILLIFLGLLGFYYLPFQKSPTSDKQEPIRHTENKGMESQEADIQDDSFPQDTLSINPQTEASLTEKPTTQAPLSNIPDPSLFSIPEYQLRRRLGLAGLAEQQPYLRPALFYRQNPPHQSFAPQAMHYLFQPEDTLRLFG